ncbi:MAG: PIN domain-containing protein [Defluviitaleaceae bacterium]|nr:PIN domain-containing protein [Defluviitaleaceae bacterium]
MILVDTSVLIDFIKGTQNGKVMRFHDVIKYNLSYGISEYTYLEILQGARNDKEYNHLNEYLLDMTIYFLPKAIDVYKKAAHIYSTLKRHGVTPRSTIDILIAFTAMEYGLSLLHNDRDFDIMGSLVPSLKIYV